jgi:hypothetical protein
MGEPRLDGNCKIQSSQRVNEFLRFLVFNWRARDTYDFITLSVINLSLPHVYRGEILDVQVNLLLLISSIVDSRTAKFPPRSSARRVHLP